MLTQEIIGAVVMLSALTGFGLLICAAFARRRSYDAFVKKREVRREDLRFPNEWKPERTYLNATRTVQGRAVYSLYNPPNSPFIVGFLFDDLTSHYFKVTWHISTGMCASEMNSSYDLILPEQINYENLNYKVQKATDERDRAAKRSKL